MQRIGYIQLVSSGIFMIMGEIGIMRKNEAAGAEIGGILKVATEATYTAYKGKRHGIIRKGKEIS
jgi:hypothetical protein